MSQPHRARRLALQALCCLDIQGPKVRDLVDEFIDDSQEFPPVIAMAHRLLRQTFDRRAECDLLLAKHARRWDLARLALVDRNILRLAVQELRQAADSPRVIISEALKLAEEFSTAESPRFINGVLDAIAHELGSFATDAGKKEPPPTEPELPPEPEGPKEA